MRRMAWREEKSLYHDICKLCGKAILSIHHPSGPFTVFCRECWYSDKWDPLDYGRDYDFSKPFFAQYRELMEAVPRPALTGTNVVDSDFSHACESCKNCYLVFWSFFSKDSQYCYALLLSQGSFDCYITDNSDHAYESLHSNRLYRVRYGYFSDECLESAFLFDCVGCSDCFGCVSLRKQKYTVFNKKLSKSEYAKEMEYWDLGSYAKLQEAKKKFRELYLATPHRYAHVLNSYDVSGDVIRDSKNCKMCFSALDGVENCKHLYVGGLSLKDSYDVSGGGDSSELLYEVFGVTQGQRCLFSVGGRGSIDITYCDWAANCADLFGCIALKNKRHCILNKQYSKEEYEALLPKIRSHMDAMPYTDALGRTYAFGEFFPMELSAYAYNESFAFPFYKKTRAETLAQGLLWRESEERSYEISVRPEDLPDHINDVEDGILKEIIGCEHAAPPALGCNEQCLTAFRVTKEELAFYRNMRVALPRLCPNCRSAERLRWRHNFDLYRRQCMCSGKHFHSSGPCPNEFETTFAPDRPEIVYCGECYRAEFL